MSTYAGAAAIASGRCSCGGVPWLQEALAALQECGKLAAYGTPEQPALRAPPAAGQ